MNLESLIVKSIKFYKVKKNNKYYAKDEHFEDYDYIDNLDYDVDNKFLRFELKHYHKEPKIGRYVQANYERRPVYEGYKERTATLKKFHKNINPIKFMEEDIFKLDYLCDDDVSYITSKILEKDDSYCPSWMKKRMDIEKIENEIEKINENNKNIKENKSSIMNQIEIGKEKMGDLNNKLEYYKNLPKNPDSKWMLFWGILLSPLIIGLFILIFYVSPNEAKENIKIELDFIEIYKKERNAFSLKINSYAKELCLEDDNIRKNDIKINNLLIQIDEINKTNYREIKKDDNGFINLRESCNLTFDKIEKGVYLIWNKTKDKYYVGQSKDVYKRLFKQHFNSGEVKSIIFAQDWFNNDEFFYKIIFCLTKDELDHLEKKLIDEFSAFDFGYNKTGGNK